MCEWASKLPSQLFSLISLYLECLEQAIQEGQMFWMTVFHPLGFVWPREASLSYTIKQFLSHKGFRKFKILHFLADLCHISKIKCYVNHKIYWKFIPNHWCATTGNYFSLVHTVHCRVHNVNYRLQSVDCTTQIVHCKVNTLCCRVHTQHCRVHTVHCRVQTVHCRVHIGHCRVHTVHCRVKLTL